MAAWAFAIVAVVPLAVNPLGPAQVIVKGAVPPLTATVKVAVAPAQTVAGLGVIVQVGLGLTTNCAEQLVVQPALSVTLAV